MYFAIIFISASYCNVLQGSMIGCWHDTVVCLSVRLCIEIKRHILQQKSEQVSIITSFGVVSITKLPVCCIAHQLSFSLLGWVRIRVTVAGSDKQ